MTKRLRITVFLFLSALISACQHAPILPPVASSEEPVLIELAKQHAQQLEAMHAFKLESKIAIQHAGKGHSGRLVWQHGVEQDQLELLSPFGQQVAVITRTPQQASLIDQQQRTHIAPNVETLTQELLGWSLPLTGLPYWVVGLPAPDRPAQAQYAVTGYLQQLEQDNWQVRYDDYRPLTKGLFDNQADSNIVLPYSIDLQRLPSKSQGAETSLKIRLKVLSWQSVH